MVTLKFIDSVAQSLRITESILEMPEDSEIDFVRHTNELNPENGDILLRSALLFLLTGVGGGQSDNLSFLAASVEHLHASSQIHSRLIDKLAGRPQAPNVDEKMDVSGYILGGDFLFINSLRGLIATADRHLLGFFLHASRQIIEGLMLQLENSLGRPVDFHTYKRIVGRKSVPIFVLIAQIAASICHCDPGKTEAMLSFADNFGYLFRYYQDFIQFFTPGRELPDHLQIMEAGFNLPLILLAEKMGKQEINILIKRGEKDWSGLLDKYHIAQTVGKLMDSHYRNCLLLFECFPLSDYSRNLEQLLGVMRDGKVIEFLWK